MDSWGEARLIEYLDGKLVLKGGSKEDRQTAHEWISMFLNDAVVREMQRRLLPQRRPQQPFARLCAGSGEERFSKTPGKRQLKHKPKGLECLP